MIAYRFTASNIGLSHLPTFAGWHDQPHRSSVMG
jgi:hypothetical protein